MEIIELRDELLETLDAINETLRAMKARHEASQANYPSQTYMSFYVMQDVQGRSLSADLLSSKANVLVAIKQLLEG